MKIGIKSIYKTFNTNNQIFDSRFYPIGQNLEKPYLMLRDKLNMLNITIDTLDIYPLEDYDKIIFLDFPRNTNDLEKLYLKEQEMYLIILESEIIKPDNMIQSNHKYFKKIFTWNDDIVDGIKYINLKCLREK